MPKQKANDLVKNGLLSALLIAPLVAISTLFERHEHTPIVLCYLSSFLIYAYLLYTQKYNSTFWVIVGLTVRVALFFTLPVLSDDFYRFLWDGRLLANGINPFDHLPGHYLDQGLPGLNSELYERLNSPEYFTIYPPVNQLLFWLSAFLGGSNLLLSVNIIRVFIVLADLVVLWSINKLWTDPSSRRGMIYFLNPLVILELTGNLHFEGLMIGFLLLGIYWFQSQKFTQSGVAFALGICSKLLPLMYFPALLIYGKFKRIVYFYVIAGIATLVMFVPLYSQKFVSGLSSSIGLYFQKFEFNASIYFIVREVGMWLTGYNQIQTIGPAMALITTLLIIGIVFVAYKKKWSIFYTILAIHTLYLLMATTVHPWYIITIVAVGALTHLKYPVVWSLLVFFTYLGYTQIGYNLPVTVVWLEYTIVILYLAIENTNWFRGVFNHKIERSAE